MISRKSLLIITLCLAAFNSTACEVAQAADPVTHSDVQTSSTFERMTSESLEGKIEGKPYDAISDFRFSPDSRWVAYIALSGRKMVLVVDGIEDKPYDRIGSFLFSPDSKRGSDSDQTPKSPDSYHLAYEASANGKWFVAENTYEPTEDGKGLVLKGSSVENPYDAIMPNSLQFSADSMRLAYVATAGKQQFVVTNAIEGQRYDAIMPSSLQFSADSMRQAYVATVGKQQFVVTNGIEGQRYDAIMLGSLHFSVDGKHVAYVAILGKQEFVVIDGREGRPYDTILDPSPLETDSNGISRFGLHFTALLREQVYSVEEWIK